MIATGAHDEFWEPTRWSIVQSASGPLNDPERRKAFETLVSLYRQPLSRCVALRLRHLSVRGETIDTLTESFFSHLLLEDVLRKADKNSGTFRSFLQGVLRNWIKWKVIEKQPKREDIERMTELEARDQPRIETAERVIWATDTLHMALGRLHAEDPIGHEILVRSEGIPPYERESSRDLAQRFEITTTNLYQKKSVAKKRLRGLVEQTIRDRVSHRRNSEAEYHEYLNWLLEAHAHVEREDDLGASGT